MAGKKKWLDKTRSFEVSLYPIYNLENDVNRAVCHKTKWDTNNLAPPPAQVQMDSATSLGRGKQSAREIVFLFAFLVSTNSRWPINKEAYFMMRQDQMRCFSWGWLLCEEPEVPEVCLGSSPAAREAGKPAGPLRAGLASTWANSTSCGKAACPCWGETMLS